MSIGGGAYSNPFFLQGELQAYGTPTPDYVNLLGKTQLDPRMASEGRAFLIIGQSESTNTTNAQLDPASDSVRQLDIYNGGVYRAQDRLLGCCTGVSALSGVYGNIFTWFAKKMVDDGACPVCVVIPIGVSGSYIAQWSGEDARPAYELKHRIAVAAARAAGAGLRIDGVIFMIGVSDSILGTTSPAWQASFALVKAAVRSAGIVSPILVGKCTGYNNANVFTTNATIQAAQAAVIDHPTGVWAGADTDTLGFAYRHDGTHFSADLTVDGLFGGSNGASAAAALWVTAVRAALGI